MKTANAHDFHRPQASKQLRQRGPRLALGFDSEALNRVVTNLDATIEARTEASTLFDAPDGDGPDLRLTQEPDDLFFAKSLLHHRPFWPAILLFKTGTF
jgi:hypothetical protein